MSAKERNPILLFGDADSCPEIEYVTGFRSMDPVLFLQKGRKRYLLVADFELSRASHSKPRARFSAQSEYKIEVLTPQTLGLSRSKRKNLSQKALKLVRRANVRRVRIPASFPYGVARRLERAGIGVTVSKGEIFPERAVKTAEEIRMIKESQQAAVIAMRTAIAVIAGSETDSTGLLKIRGERLTSEHIKRTISKVLVEHNCYCREIIVAGGLQAADPHLRGNGPLRCGEAIVIDIFPQHMEHGYWGDLTRTVVRGKPSLALRKMYLAVKSAQSAALNHVKAGVKYVTVHQSAVEEFKRCGFGSTVINGRGAGFIHNTGHGVGLTIHEAPSIAPSKGRLRSGNVITVEPGLYYPDIGGIRIEDTIVVTPKGWRYLVPCEKKFEY